MTIVGRSKLLLAVLALVSTAATASAQDGCWPGWGMGWGGGFWNQPIYGGVGSVYGSGYVPVPPYYSIHPPVYYGSRIYRSYGDSPFAYAPSRPAGRVQSYAELNEPAPRPQMIYNPYYQADVVESVQPIENAKIVAPEVKPEVPPAPPVIENKNPPIKEQPLPPPADKGAAAGAAEKSAKAQPQMIFNPYVTQQSASEVKSVNAVARRTRVPMKPE